MNQKDRDLLIEAAVTAFRERDAEGRIRFSPAWRDLPPQDREALFEAQLAARRVERAVDPEGLSTTSRAVLARLPWLGQIEGNDS